MKRVSIVRGRPIYIYKGSQYVDKPDKTKVTKMKYSEDEGITYIYLKHTSSFYEVMCIAILIALVVFNRSVAHNLEMGIRYNSLVNYYHGKLYLNITADKNNPKELRYSFGSYDGVLNPGESLISVDVDEPLDNYTITFSYDKPLGEASFEVMISVINRDTLEDYDESE